MGAATLFDLYRGRYGGDAGIDAIQLAHFARRFPRHIDVVQLKSRAYHYALGPAPHRSIAPPDISRGQLLDRLEEVLATAPAHTLKLSQLTEGLAQPLQTVPPPTPPPHLPPPLLPSSLLMWGLLSLLRTWSRVFAAVPRLHSVLSNVVRYVFGRPAPPVCISTARLFGFAFVTRPFAATRRPLPLAAAK